METRRDREIEVTLPIGYEEPTVCSRTTVLRKITGRDSRSWQTRPPEQWRPHDHRALASCVVAREHRAARPLVLRVFTPPIATFSLRVREITFGAEMQATYSCPTRREATTTVEDLAELEVVALDDGEVARDVVVELQDGYVDKGGEVYHAMVFRYPKGADEEKVAPAIRENAAHGKNALMARCLRAMGDMSQQRMEALGTAIFNDLTLSDRARIDRALNDGTSPGIKMPGSRPAPAAADASRPS
jgi:hypothetical protein